MPVLNNGRYRARIAANSADLRAAQRLRFKRFVGPGEGLDRDRFDDVCTHILIEETSTEQLVGCFRVLLLRSGNEIWQSYSAQFYDLSALQRFDGKMAELGRFCIDSQVLDPDVLRIAWMALTRYVDENAVEILFGCSSFQGTKADAYLDTFAMLKEGYLAPERWLPQIKAPRVFCFAEQLRLRKPDIRTAMQRMPPLLRTYLVMGGWVSDHAVVDCELNTLHVFTGLEISAIPEARKRLLRAAAQ